MKNEEKKEQESVTSGEMTDKEMIAALVSIYNTRTWAAIMKFNRKIDMQIINSLLAIDPIEKATDISRAQGMRSGIYLIEQEVEREIKRINNPEEEKK